MESIFTKELKLDIVLNTKREIYKVFSGEVERVQKKGVDAFMDVYGISVKRKADITITFSYPLETNFIQSAKAGLIAERVTKPGGTIILLTACLEGIGKMFYEALKDKLRPEEALEWIEKGRISPSGGVVISRLRRLLEGKGVIIVTNRSLKEKIRDMDMEYAPSIQDAISLVSKRYKKAPDVIILPIGGLTFPLID